MCTLCASSCCAEFNLRQILACLAFGKLLSQASLTAAKDLEHTAQQQHRHSMNKKPYSSCFCSLINAASCPFHVCCLPPLLYCTFHSKWLLSVKCSQTLAESLLQTCVSTNDVKMSGQIQRITAAVVNIATQKHRARSSSPVHSSMLLKPQLEASGSLLCRPGDSVALQYALMLKNSTMLKALCDDSKMMCTCTVTLSVSSSSTFRTVKSALKCLLATSCDAMQHPVYHALQWQPHHQHHHMSYKLIGFCGLGVKALNKYTCY